MWTNPHLAFYIQPWARQKNLPAMQKRNYRKITTDHSNTLLTAIHYSPAINWELQIPEHTCVQREATKQLNKDWKDDYTISAAGSSVQTAIYQYSMAFQDDVGRSPWPCHNGKRGRHVAISGHSPSTLDILPSWFKIYAISKMLRLTTCSPKISSILLKEISHTDSNSPQERQ